MADQPWLDATEQQAWRTYLTMARDLNAQLHRHLQREFGLSQSDYEILVNLSEAPGQRMSATRLCELTRWEKSRLSHHLRRMTERGLVCRDESTTNRYPEIALTEKGQAAITEAAPAHAALVHTLVIDALGPDRLANFADACTTIRDTLAHHDATHSDPHQARA